MTIVAWDGKTLAADKRTSFGGLHATTTKLHRIDGMLIGCAGLTAHITEMVAWVKAGREAAQLPTPQRSTSDCISMLLIDRDGSVLHYESSAYPILIEGDKWAIGSGRDFAMAAMHLGCDARRAVEVACALDATCGNGIDTLELL